MTTFDPRGSSELRPTSVPLVNLSRSPSPYSRKQSSSGPSGEEEEEAERAFEHVAVGQPSSARLDVGNICAKLVHNRGLLVMLVGVCSFLLLFCNRLILWSKYHTWLPSSRSRC